ncbi:extracellular solute-binding protein [Paenibacillus hexagrammi]|uniref:Extracellular solute-binding protein n=1 Tax=Paenibacillus hexagrammi TaxID=2908839 RepID=A0ABY3SP40_9BACL|nr:extracellular solute-binding protein [Paenibacillus sp. YPD9-1]UJF34861.1 extracellular solute-binding protein [Paenibacillus sp. YPD9-1]
MRNGRRFLKLASVLLCLLCASCYNESASGIGSSSKGEGSPDHEASAAYKDTVTLHIGFQIPDSKLPPGDSNDNNPVSRYLEGRTNIHVVNTWEAKGEDAFKQKVDLAIASNDLPDAVVVDRNQLKKLVSSGMILDLTQTYAAYASELVRSIYDSTKGSALQDASFDGKLYGLPNVALDADSSTLLWVRQDWLEKLKLPAPRTMEDVERIAQAFISQDPGGRGNNATVGLTGFKGIVYGQKPLFNGFDVIFNAYNAYPKNWIRDSSGRIVYGSITPENKQALSKLADWYKRGWIDPNFALYNESEQPIIENKTGLFFGPWWMPYYPLNFAVENDTKAEWRAYPVPLNSEGVYVTHIAPTTDRYLVVRKGYDHPEAVMKLVNEFTSLERNRTPDTPDVNKLSEYVAKSGSQLRNFYPFDLLLDYSNAVEKRYFNVASALKGDIDSSKLDPDARNIYKQTVEEMDNPKKNMENWKAAAANQYGASVLATARIQKVYSVFYGSTPTMETKWQELQKLENEAFLKIIIGDQPVSSFDDFVVKWKELGGEQITEEVREAVSHH